MLWNVVYEFFVKNIFGGVLFSNGSYTRYSFILGGYVANNEFRPMDTSTLSFSLFGNVVPIGNYLSLIATIISMVVIVVLACLFIKKIYNMVAHVIA